MSDLTEIEEAVDDTKVRGVKVYLIPGSASKHYWFVPEHEGGTMSFNTDDNVTVIETWYERALRHEEAVGVIKASVWEGVEYDYFDKS